MIVKFKAPNPAFFIKKTSQSVMVDRNNKFFYNLG